MKTKIEWTDYNWNMIDGCSRTSPGCMNCYAESIARRFSKPGLRYEGLIARTGQWNGNVGLAEDHLYDPLRWKKPRRIFVNSMSDTFHESVPEEWLDQIFAVMALCPQHTFQLLTKRADRMLNYFKNHFSRHKVAVEARKFTGKANVFSGTDWGCDPDICNGEFPLKNVWLGVSIENQETANERIPLLLETPAAVRWLSCEPLLGSVDLTDIDAGVDRSIPIEYWTDADDEDSSPAVAINALTGEKWQRWGEWAERGPGIDWVVAGGESGRCARPSHPDWFRSLRDQCKAVGTKFFFKQWGEWAPGECVPPGLAGIRKNASWFNSQWHFGVTDMSDPEDGWMDEPDLYLVGKKRAGRLLDGELWDQYAEDI